jgi:molybdate transport system substrate-binding protein
MEHNDAGMPLFLDRLVRIVLLGGLLAALPARADTTVFAAASLKGALDEVAAGYRKHTRAKVTVSYAASSALAQQIVRGAPADLFISADRDWMDYIEKKGLVQKGTRVNLLSNRLVLVAPAGSKAAFAIGPRFPLGSLLGERRLAMADPDYVPAGKYGRAALEKLGVWQDVSGKLARGENVRAALAFVARGETPFGIVYRTDALAERAVRIVGEFGADLHPPIAYPAAIVSGSRSTEAAGLLAHLRSPVARAVWERHGFSVSGR